MGKYLPKLCSNEKKGRFLTVYIDRHGLSAIAELLVTVVAMFLPRDAVQARPMPSCGSVCLSVCHVRGFYLLIFFFTTR